jgi:hypothetical protein
MVRPLSIAQREMAFDEVRAAPYILAALAQAVTTLLSAFSTWLAEREFARMEGTKTVAQYSGVGKHVPKDTLYSDLLPVEYRPNRISSVYSWSRDLALLLTSAISITVAVVAPSHKSGLSIVCIVWWLVVLAAFVAILRGGFDRYRDFRIRIWVFGPASIAAILVNVALIPVAGYRLMA